MKVLKEQGSFEVRTPAEELKRQFMEIEMAGRTAYQSFRGEVTQESAKRFVAMLLRSGHESVIEHTSLEVKFTGVSRGLTHELVRHRLASFTQESTRYVDYAKGGDSPDLERFQLECVFPPHRDEMERVDLGGGRMMTPVEMMEEIELFYRGLRRAGWKPEDAREFLPNATGSDVVMTANWREWRHVFGMRTQKAAHWEIRKVMGDLLVGVQGIIPVVFDDFVEAGVDNNGLRYFERR